MPGVLFSTLFFEIGSFTEPGPSDWLEWLAHQTQGASCLGVTGVHSQARFFLSVGSGD